MLRLAFSKQAVKGIRQLPPSAAARIRAELDAIAGNPATYRGDWKPLQGSPFWRLRVGGWRAICEIRENELALLVLKIGPRVDVYK
ncbi:type II toxin-antitoxin system RelE/ParE family toxin [Thiohalocapsa marina]|uniref:Type II toxin-antitoxin system RelE/ParE family toxin n=1 Tax=Thiohalocapsa marina TaxID=424902 RepID=A0A5M8FMU9_9GAMM|nr:type II toxin-antitoxin system RelE/ParE family toxin [Thiohalocapsa marina]KAA6186208.1 type II toxin-antitoxin system RelE/ParE family toxin [Thiohalocapsa marina]